MPALGPRESYSPGCRWFSTKYLRYTYLADPSNPVPARLLNVLVRVEERSCMKVQLLKHGLENQEYAVIFAKGY
jgi:hypothetical protein